MRTGLLSALVVLDAPLPAALVDAAVAQYRACPTDTGLLLGLLRRPELDQQVAESIARPTRAADPHVSAALYARPGTPVPDVVASVSGTRRRRHLRVLLSEPSLSTAVCDALAAVPAAAGSVLARSETSTAGRVRALLTLDAAEFARGQGDNVTWKVRTAMEKHPLPADDLAAVVASCQSFSVPKALASCPMGPKGQRALAGIVDSVLKGGGVKTSAWAVQNRVWCAELTLALVKQPELDPVTRRRLCRSWDRRGPKSSTQLAALNSATLAEQIACALWEPERRVLTSQLEDVLDAAASDQSVAAALLSSLERLCANEPSHWRAAASVLEAGHGTVGESLTALEGVLG